MMVVYIIGIFVCMILAVYFLTRIHSQSQQKEILELKRNRNRKYKFATR